MRVGVKAAWIGGVAIILAALVTALLSKSAESSNEIQMQKIKEQKVDSGSINNYTAGRDLKIENNNYSVTYDKSDSIKETKNKNNTFLSVEKRVTKNRIVSIQLPSKSKGFLKLLLDGNEISHLGESTKFNPRIDMPINYQGKKLLSIIFNTNDTCQLTIPQNITSDFIRLIPNCYE